MKKTIAKIFLLFWGVTFLGYASFYFYGAFCTNMASDEQTNLCSFEEDDDTKIPYINY